MKEQILALYEVSELTVEEIAGQLSVEPEVVSAVLRQYSALFRSQNPNGENSEDFDDIIFMKARDTLAESMDAENEFIKLSAAKFIFQEKKGRNDPKAPVVNLNGNTIVMINERMKRLKAARQVSPPPAIEV